MKTLLLEMFQSFNKVRATLNIFSLRCTKLSIRFLALIALFVSGNAVGQAVSTYSFTSLSGTYIPVSSTSNLLADSDNGQTGLLDIGFPFQMGIAPFTQFSAGSNGYIRLGNTLTTSNYAPISTTGNTYVISGAGGLDGRTTGGVFTELQGSAPNRVRVIQYSNYRVFWTGDDYLHFQIRLYEGTNEIEIVYGASTRVTNRDLQIGLRGINTAADFNNRMGTGAWNSAAAGTANSSTLRMSTTNYPASGLTFRWTPTAPACASLSSPSNGSTNTALNQTISWGATLGATGYDVYFGTSSTPPLVSTNQTGTTYNPGTLLPSTTYYHKIVPKNTVGSATGCNTWSFTTLTPPSNDQCVNATNLTIGAAAVSGSLTNATYEAPFTEKSEVWYQFTPSCTGNLTITLSGLPNDKDLYLYSGNCGSLSQLQTSTNSGTSNEVITFTFTAGVTYRLAVYDYNNSGGSFNIGVSLPTAPSQPSAITGPLSPAPGSSQVYSVTNVSGVTYSWSFPSGWNITAGQGTNSVTVTVGSTNGTISVTPSISCVNGTARTTTTTIPLRRITYNSVNFGSANWCQGETRIVTLNVTNTGTESFSTANSIRFGYAWGTDWYDSNPQGSYSTIDPGQSGNVTFSVTSPNIVGATNLKFSTVKDGVCWFHSNSGDCGPGNIEYTTSTINIKPIPTAVNAGSDLSICSGSSAQLNGSANPLNVCSLLGSNSLTNPSCSHKK